MVPPVLEIVDTKTECIGCGNDFYPLNPRQNRCKDNCGKGRATDAPTSFIGVDGEGITLPDGSHYYVLLSCGSASLSRGGRELTYEEIFSFLYQQFCRFPYSAFVGFFLSYDFTYWLKSLPQDRAWYLLTDDGIAKRARKKSGANRVPFPVGCGDWEFDMLANKRFKLRPKAPSGKPALPWMNVCDAGSFFQASFLSVIDPKGWEEPIATKEEWDTILEGKAKRSTAEFDDDMIRYNVTENTVMSKLMVRLEKGYRHAGIRMNKDQWFGPGQPATKWLTSIGAPLSVTVQDITPREAINAARASYYGGWFEVFNHGIVPGTTYGYDINSAYPYAISTLPCLLHGRWTQENVRRADVQLVRATVTSDFGTLGAMLHRGDDGRILRPRHTEGWFHLSELRAAKGCKVKIHERWNFIQLCDHKPFAPIVELYNERLAVGKNSPAGKALKLLYNSAYGKMAQSVGSPKFANPLYASMITSHCRRMILDAIHTHPMGPRALVMVATDGVYFTSPHTGLSLSESELGAWSEEFKDDLSIFMPGVYWDGKTREALKNGGTLKLRSRGINGQDLGKRIGEIDDLWSRFNGINWPSLEIPIRFSMVTAKQALARNDWATAGKVSSYDLDSSTVRLISSDPRSKRNPIAYRDGELWRTDIFSEARNGVKSEPYKKSIGMYDDEGITPDGMINDEIQDWLQRAHQ